MANFEDFRKKYSQSSIDEKDVPKNPFDLFQSWMIDAINAQIIEPNAMILSTVDQGYKPSSRTVLLKETSEEGFVFYTNYTSRKATDIMVNPNVSLLFSWIPIERQIRINGVAVRLTEEKNNSYFQKRPKGSQIGAWASPQSLNIPNRKYLDDRYQEFEKIFKSQDTIQKPAFWGGYAVRPTSIEFWQGRDNRLHDRIKYSLKDLNWEIKRLAP